jgi:hypothetical protein
VLRQKAAVEADRAALERAAMKQRNCFDEARQGLEVGGVTCGRPPTCGTKGEASPK